MLKKVLSGIICISLFICLCGCGGYRETDSCYIVTALGFDRTDRIKVTVEVVTAADNQQENPAYTEIISGEGSTPEDAVFSLSSSISKTLMFDHCTAVIVGKSLNKSDYGNVINYGKELKELNLSVYLLTCDNAEKLLTKSQPVSVSRGFDIAGNIKETKKDTGIDYKNRFFEVFARYSEKEFYTLPILALKDKRIIIDGEAVYKDKTQKFKLSNEESLMYSFVKNDNSGGKIYIGKEYADISSSRFSVASDRYIATLHIENESKGFKKAFTKNCNDFLKKHNRKLKLKAEKAEVKIKGGV